MAPKQYLAIICMFIVSAVEGSDYITYNCTSPGISIDFSKPDLYEEYQVALVRASRTGKDNNTQCDMRMQNITGPLKSANCNYTGNWVLYLRTNATDVENGLGIDYITTKYNLPCDTYGATVNRTVVVGLDSTTIPVLPTILSMTTSPANISLGDKVNVTITDKSNGQHTLHLESCTASTEDGTANVEMIQNGNITESTLVDAINPTGSTAVGFTFYGFRFVSSSKVELKCTVQVCLKSSNCTMAVFNCNAPSLQQPSQKRFTPYNNDCRCCPNNRAPGR